MAKNFLTATANFDDFINLASGEINGHVIKNNETALKKAYAFFQSDSKLLLLNGFAGVGKKQIAEHLLSYMGKETLSFRFVCTESTKLDDIQLYLYRFLLQKTSLKDTSEIDAIDSLSEKIDFILSKINLNYVFVFYNFDILKDEVKPDILNYIYSFSSKENVKSVIVSRVFDTDIIPTEVKYVKLIIKALSKEIFEQYIREFGIKVTPAMVDQLYRLSRGYFFSICLSCKIMINQEYSINDFIVQYTNSGQKFDDFLAQTYYRLIVGTTKSAFNLFVKLHHGLNLKVLQTIGSYPDVILKTLSENFYIYKKGDLYYPAEFLKIQLEKIVGEEVSKKRLASYYEKQIELSPEDRDFLISRSALLEEIAFYKDIPIEVKADEISSQNISHEPDKIEEKPENIDFENLSPKEVFDKALEFFNSFDYIKVVNALTFLLSNKEKIAGSDVLYDTYYLLAKTYSKMQKWKYALYYYEMLEQHYKNVSDIDNLHFVQYETARVYYSCFRIIDAIKVLKTLCSVSKNNGVQSACNVLLGNIALTASNPQLAYEYYKEGVKYVDENTSNNIKMELFFKYAIMSDENNDMNNAIEYYQKCIEIDDEKSKYKALAYSNLGDLFYDNELFEEARDCFEKAYNSDKLNENEYGMYYALSKYLDLCDNKDKEKLVKTAKEVKEHAVKSEDYNAIVSSTIKLGDIYYDYPEPEKALTEYLEVYKIEDLEEHNLKVVKSRLEDIRARLGKEKFEELVPNYE